MRFCLVLSIVWNKNAAQIHSFRESRRYAANGVRLPKDAAFGRAEIVYKREKRQKYDFACASIVLNRL